MSWRRLGREALICLCLAAFITIGVSWMFAWLAGRNLTGKTTVFRSTHGHYRELTGPGLTSIHLTSNSVSWTYMYDAFRGDDAAIPVNKKPPAWARTRQTHDTMTTVAFGWPMRSLSFAANFADDGPPYRSRAIWYHTPAREWALPTTAIWRGLIVNAVLYAGVIWLLFFGVSCWRRHRRTRRGRCAACGYDVGPLERCPECGQAA